jgi:glycine/D-amino acid oxidase-like deaminating enzyme
LVREVVVMLDLLIIGGGFFGTAAAVQAQQIGASFTVVDSAEAAGGSVNAAGLLHPVSDSVANRIPEHWRASPHVDWLDRFAMLTWIREEFSTYLKPGQVKVRNDVLIAEPRSILSLITPEKAHVCIILRTASGWHVQGTRGEQWAARRVIIAAGVWTDKLLRPNGFEPTGVTSLPGGGAIVDVPGAPRDRLRSWLTRPYTTFTLRPWGDRWRFGDTVERGGGQDMWHRELLPAMGKYLPAGTVLQGAMFGYRPVTPQLHVELAAKDLVVSTGGHRSGLWLAGPAADRAIKLLGMQ